MKYYSPILVLQKGGIEDWRMFHISGDKLYEADPVLFWRPVGNHPYTDQRFKGPIVTVPKSPGIFRIICYGDSNTEGSLNENWPEEFQKILYRENIEKRRRYECLNAGVAGYSSYQGLMRFREEVGLYKPDLIFVSFGWNDIAPAISLSDNEFHTPHPISIFIQRILLKYRFYLSLKYYLIEMQKPHRTVDYLPRVSLKDYLANLNEFVETARKHNTSIVLLTRPYKMRTKNIKELPSWRKYVPSYNRELLKFAKRKGILCIDVQNIFGITDNSDLFIDECHFTLYGYRKMAQMLYKELLNNGYLPNSKKEI